VIAFLFDNGRQKSQFTGFHYCTSSKCLSSDLHYRQFNGSKTRIADKGGMRNLWVLIELAATNWFQRRQRIGSSHTPATFSFLSIRVRLARTVKSQQEEKLRQL
jgi:hypothetical protein